MVMAKFFLQERHDMMLAFLPDHVTQCYFVHSMVLRGPLIFETDPSKLNLILFRDANFKFVRLGIIQTIPGHES